MSSAKHTSEGSFVEKNCAWCGKIFVAKKADVILAAQEGLRMAENQSKKVEK